MNEAKKGPKNNNTWMEKKFVSALNIPNNESSLVKSGRLLSRRNCSGTIPNDSNALTIRPFWFGSSRKETITRRAGCTST